MYSKIGSGGPPKKMECTLASGNTNKILEIPISNDSWRKGKKTFFLTIIALVVSSFRLSLTHYYSLITLKRFESVYSWKLKLTAKNNNFTCVTTHLKRNSLEFQFKKNKKKLTDCRKPISSFNPNSEKEIGEMQSIYSISFKYDSWHLMKDNL